MKKIFICNLLLFLLVSCCDDSSAEYFDSQSNSEALNNQSVSNQRLNPFDANRQKYYNLLRLHFVSTDTLSHRRLRRDRDWEIASAVELQTHFFLITKIQLFR